jgi:uracil-DNA glycosylase
MVINDRIKEQLGTWWPWMQELVESEQWDNLYKFLKQQVKAGRTIIPKSDEVWKSLQLCNKDKVKAIVLLQCPYATMRDKVVIADGIPMNCKNIAPYQQPSLYQWQSAIENQYGFNPDNDIRADITYLLEEEHILLLNTANTVELNKVDSHAQNWQPITRWFCENVISKYLPGVPVVMCGTQAQKFEPYLNPMKNPLKKVEHMAAASYANRDWKHEKMHLWIDEIIRQNNGESEVPRWTRIKGETKKVEEELPAWVTETNYGKDDLKDLPWEQ